MYKKTCFCKIKKKNFNKLLLTFILMPMLGTWYGIANNNFVTNAQSNDQTIPVLPSITFDDNGIVYVNGNADVTNLGSGRTCVQGSGNVDNFGDGSVTNHGHGPTTVLGNGVTHISGAGDVYCYGGGTTCFGGQGSLIVESIPTDGVTFPFGTLLMGHSEGNLPVVSLRLINGQTLPLFSILPPVPPCPQQPNPGTASRPRTTSISKPPPYMPPFSSHHKHP